MTNLQAQWIVGFTDGEGHFGVAINKNEQTVPDTTNQLLEPIQASTAIITKIIGQEELIKNFSNQTKK